MSKNPSYARFEYTYNDLKDCLEHITDTLDSETESSFRYKLIELCREVVSLYDDELMAFDDEPIDEEE